MKKWFPLIAVMMVLSLSGCGQSEAAKAVDDQIAAIGEVSLDSEDAIAAAESALAALSEEDQKQVKNEEKLTEARSSYEGLVNQSKADEVDAAISAIGEVTLDSAEAISSARALYDGAEDDVKALVKGTADLESAETKLDEMQIAEATDLIAAIGEVNAESSERIEAAQAAYDKLSSEQQAKVSNAAELSAASEQVKAIKKERAEALLAGMTMEEDRFQGLQFYYPSAWKFYSDGSWVADERSFVLPYVGREGDRLWIRVIYNYTADDWVFFKKITVLADGERFTKTFSYFDIVHDNGGGRIWEYIDTDATGDEEMLWAIANSSETMIRFEGDDYADDVTIRDSDKQALREALEAYEAMME